MKIKIRPNSAREFPYGTLLQIEKDFIINNVGNIFNVSLTEFNYYILENRVRIHIYDCLEVTGDS